jgi:hypothetical protein
MIPIEVLKRVQVVYTHKNCPDGMATAMILKDAFRMLGTNPRIEFLAHNTKEHRESGYMLEDGLKLFCDIAPHPDTANILSGTLPKGGIVLDHHKGVEELVRSFGEFGVFADEELDPGVSGAVLAYCEVWEPIWQHGPSAVRDRGGLRSSTDDFAMCVGARDTWQTKDPRFHRGQWISKFLMSKPAAFFLDQVVPYGRRGEAPEVRPHTPYLSDEEVHAGTALFDAHEEAVRQAVDQCVNLFVEGFHLHIFQEQASGFRLTSDVAEALRRRFDEGDGEHPPPADIIVGFSYVVDMPGGDPKLLYSLRSTCSFDVAAFAKANGGGGHTKAAGFSVPIRHRSGGATNLDPYLEIFKRVADFL